MRGFLGIDISSYFDKNKDFFALIFLRDLIYKPDSINADVKKKDNATFVNELESFLKKDFDKIYNLLGNDNYPETKWKIDEGCEKSFYLRFPSAKDHTK